ncbi:MAG: stage III sporulation protein AE, partial [Clostridia bacterium]|nr:stage III sporulation protein AE [Clostridia bacterium]
KLIIIAVICSILQTLQAAFEKGTVAKLAYFVCYLVIITLAIGSFKLAIDIGLAAITKMVSFMELLLPVLLVLLTAMGGLTTVALLQPFLLLFLSFMSAFTQNIIFPFIFLTAVLAIANDISDNFKVSKIASLFKQLTKVGIGLVLTLFIGVITVEGVAGSVVDGVTLRTAKYVTGAFVPVAGSMFADALDAVIGGSLLLKNAIGITGVLVLAIIVIFPVLKIIAIAVIYHLAAALLQPLGNSQIAQVLDDMSSSLFLTFAAVASVAIMFFMTITIIVGAANFTVMLR